MGSFVKVKSSAKMLALIGENAFFSQNEPEAGQRDSFNNVFALWATRSSDTHSIIQ